MPVSRLAARVTVTNTECQQVSGRLAAALEEGGGAVRVVAGGTFCAALTASGRVVLWGKVGEPHLIARAQDSTRSHGRLVHSIARDAWPLPPAVLPRDRVRRSVLAAHTPITKSNFRHSVFLRPGAGWRGGGGCAAGRRRGRGWRRQQRRRRQRGASAGPHRAGRRRCARCTGARRRLRGLSCPRLLCCACGLGAVTLLRGLLPWL